MGPKTVCRALEIFGSKVRCLRCYCIAQTCGRLEEFFTCNFMDWLSCECGRMWRCSCSWLELPLPFPFTARVVCQGPQRPRRVAGGAEGGVSHPGGEDNRRLPPLMQPHKQRKLASSGTEAVQMHPYHTRWLRLPAWVQHTWFSGSELVPLCPVMVLVRKQPDGNCREIPKSERGGEQRESTGKQRALSDALTLGETNIK